MLAEANRNRLRKLAHQNDFVPMTPAAAHPKTDERRLLLICMLLSGGCALVYEVVWLRAFDLLFGQTASATAVVLSAYMAGLGLGAHVVGAWIDRRKADPVKTYGWLEGAIAGYALLTPMLWRGIDAADLVFQNTVHPSGPGSTLFKFLIAFLALLPPTFFMGGTLPVAAKALVRSAAHWGYS
jgi:spermidine synthase